MESKGVCVFFFPGSRFWGCRPVEYLATTTVDGRNPAPVDR